MDQKPSRFRELLEKYREFILYAFFGIFTTGSSWLSYGICEAILHMNLYYSGIVSWITAVTVAFVTNKLWVFESKSWKLPVLAKEVLTFFGGRAITGVFEVVGVPALVEIGVDQTLLGVEGFVAKMLVTAIVILFNYIVSKFVVFSTPGRPGNNEGRRL